MTIREVIEHHSEVIPVFINYGLHCIGCPLAQDETVEQAARTHKIDLEKLLKDLNKATKE
jgi:hybrid cluster-associated redox disulfide protein